MRIGTATILAALALAAPHGLRSPCPTPTPDPDSCQSSGLKKRVILSEATLIFVWPVYMLVDAQMSVEEMRRELERADRDQPFSAQFRRLRDKAVGLGFRPMRCPSQEAHFEFLQPSRTAESVDLTKQDEWRGTVLFCPGHHPVVSKGLTADDVLLGQLHECPGIGSPPPHAGTLVEAERHSQWCTDWHVTVSTTGVAISNAQDTCGHKSEGGRSHTFSPEQLDSIRRALRDAKLADLPDSLNPPPDALGLITFTPDDDIFTIRVPTPSGMKTVAVTGAQIDEDKSDGVHRFRSVWDAIAKLVPEPPH
jgi:hypothetical protein